ncbi:hypothetical protein LBBP_01166 [Leptospira borgpetersenii serovar Ballum]|uniref:Uncharacterized protein n=1 Tax=Leptospira borgpetersenii serovar Ballum TaxID=280505 RepID=A0A0S2IP63_LEPBO|nr:hypothetical protein LBBP_01166 [Leptospira borgpetersenii serovar Ballum]
MLESEVEFSERLSTLVETNLIATHRDFGVTPSQSKKEKF